MNLPFTQRLLSNTQKGVEKALPAFQPLPVEARMGSGKKPSNPFLTAMDTSSEACREAYGVNKPLSKPMFLGYRDNEAMYGGSRLFILY